MLLVIQEAKVAIVGISVAYYVPLLLMAFNVPVINFIALETRMMDLDCKADRNEFERFSWIRQHITVDLIIPGGPYIQLICTRYILCNYIFIEYGIDFYLLKAFTAVKDSLAALVTLSKGKVLSSRFFFDISVLLCSLFIKKVS